MKASKQEPILISRRLSENVPPMEDEDLEAKTTLELIQCFFIKSLNRARIFCITQPVIAFLLLLLLYYLISINRKVNRLESAFNELLELHRATQEQRKIVTTTMVQTT